MLIVLALGATTVVAQEKAADPGAKREDLEATLVAFKGTVDVKRPEDKDWVPAERNMKLKRGSEVCTSVASVATLLFTGKLKIDVRPLTQAKVEELARLGSEVNADLKLKFGAIEVDLEKGDLRTDMKVSAPNSTTSVSGSHGIVRAPATEGGCRVTLRTTTGTWSHEAAGVERGIFGEDVADNHGNQLRDLRALADSHDFLDFFGRDKHELNQSRFSQLAGDANPWNVPLFDFVNMGPTGPRNKRASVLPLPPGTP
ncbi:MAG: hypothetical protein HY293_18385 [Planctomycetes bacterium]|nr:hypothetical protein [Planctomycetota bacterium]